jgi:hypothetical protein
MFDTPWRAMMLAALLLCSVVLLSTCGGTGGDVLYVQDVTQDAQTYAGQEITVDGAYVWRPDDPATPVLALGVSTLDSGLDAQPLGDSIWVDGFPAEVTADLHRPGDSVYGFVRVRGLFETGSFGPNGEYSHRIQVSHAEPIEQVRYVEHTLPNEPLGEGKVSLAELQANPERYDGQQITTRGYYFWNSVIWVLAEGVATEEGGGSPKPLGDTIWMEGFPPEVSTSLNVGPHNSFVWGLVEVTGTFQTGGDFGKDGAYNSIITVDSAVALESNAN